MKINIGCLIVVMALSSFFAQSQLPFKEVISKYRTFLIAQDTTAADSIMVWSSSLQPNGEWRNVAYADQNVSSWKTPEHLGRIVKLSAAYHNPSSKFFNNPQVWDKIILAINHWIEKKYRNTNWWYNDIGVPQYWRDIIALNYEKFKPEELSKSLSILGQYKLKEAFTGANLVWSADLAMHYGIFTANDGLVRKGSTLIIDEIKISKGEGIRADYSYHQHGARSQTHHYGASFLKENIRLAYELQHTPWAFPAAKVTLLKDYLVEGWQWMSRGVYVTPATLDRSISRKGFLKQDLTTLLPYLIQLCPTAEADDLQKMLKVQQTGKQTLLGYKYYPYSDVAALQQKEFTLILKTISTRTEVSENINGENQQGTFLNLGNTFFIRNGNEYLDLMPVWDWTKLPGTTNFQGAKTINRLVFVGGVSSGQSGLAAMDFETANQQSKLTGSKFWVMHKGQVFCLIANLNLSGSTDPIFTTLEQSRLQGKVTTGKGWVNHNGFTYVALTGTPIVVTDKKVTGTWSTLSKSGSSTPVSENVFKAILPHQQNSASAYLIDGLTPLANVKQLLAHPDWEILKNTGECQALAFKDGTAMLSFHQKGELQVKNTLVKVNKPCLIILTPTDIHASDPLHKGGELEIELNGKKIIVNLPADGLSVKHTRK